MVEGLVPDFDTGSGINIVLRDKKDLALVLNFDQAVKLLRPILWETWGCALSRGESGPAGVGEQGGARPTGGGRSQAQASRWCPLFFISPFLYFYFMLFIHSFIYLVIFYYFFNCCVLFSFYGVSRKFHFSPQKGLGDGAVHCHLRGGRAGIRQLHREKPQNQRGCHSSMRAWLFFLGFVLVLRGTGRKETHKFRGVPIWAHTHVPF